MSRRGFSNGWRNFNDVFVAAGIRYGGFVTVSDDLVRDSMEFCRCQKNIFNIGYKLNIIKLDFYSI